MRVDLGQPITLQGLAAVIGVRPPAVDRPISGVAIDSRAAVAGDLFVALRGERTDGNQFVPALMDAGIAALTARTDLIDQPGALVHADPLAALMRVANSLTGTDLLVVSAEVDAASLQRAWMYVPRMLHRSSLVYLEEASDDGDGRRFVRLSLGEVNRLAESQQTSYRRAA